MRSHVWLSKFLPLFTVRTSQIEPRSENEGRIGYWDAPDPEDEEWVPNFQAAGLLATKDLNLRQYTSLERKRVNDRERQALWRVARNMLSFDYDANAFNTSVEHAFQKDREERPKFMAMQEVFWVKVNLNDQGYHRSLTFLSSCPISKIKFIDMHT